MAAFLGNQEPNMEEQIDFHAGQTHVISLVSTVPDVNILRRADSLLAFLYYGGRPYTLMWRPGLPVYAFVNSSTDVW
jgi:hypothetical protein